MRQRCALLVSIFLQVCVGQQKKFNFPNKMQALLGSCVEIPCSTTVPPGEAQNYKVVWHVQPARLGERVIYSTDVSQISPDYRNRAELVRRTTENCTLRIHDVTRKDGRSFFPQENKIAFHKRSSTFVQLEVTDHPPEPILSVPGEMVIGETTTMTCMANYTCASSPPSFTWNLIGPYNTERSDLGDGKWRATSKLTYKPSEGENGSIIQCSVTYFGGQKVEMIDKINIKVREKTNQYIGPVIGVTCVILLLAIVFIIWRKRKSCFWRKKTEYSQKSDPNQNTLSKNSSRYADLLERQKSSYYTLEPTANNHLARPKRNMMPLPESAPIYEDMSIKRPN